MSPGRTRNRRVQAELDELTRLGVLSPSQKAVLASRYPTSPWDVASLARVFSVFGILLVATGIVVLVREHLDWWLVSEAFLATAGLALLAGGRLLKGKGRLPSTAEALELGGALFLQGLVWVLAVHHSTGSGDWPSVVGVNTVLALGIAYAVANRLVLWLACANLFVWLGGRSGFDSDWGAYWLGMDWPLRYLALAAVMLGAGWWQSTIGRGRWAPFGRVYLHFGLLSGNLALWFLSLFGSYTDGHVRWHGTESERLIFTVFWALVCWGCMAVAARTGLRLLRGWGLTFLVIDVYTFYFQFVVANSSSLWFLHMLLVGGSLLALGANMERLRGSPAAEEKPPEPSRPEPGPEEDHLGGA